MERTPSAARVYDWYLGGANNFEVDREFGNKVLAAMPAVKAIAAANRAFLHRAVHYLADHGDFCDRGVFDHHALDVKRADAVTG